jgi:stage III sporulation protein AH
VFIVKRKSEIVRFGLFLALAGLMAWFVMSRSELFRTSRTPGAAGDQQQAAALPRKQGPNTERKGTPDLSTGANFLAQYRIEREQQRSAREEQLLALIDNPNVADDARKAASEELRTAQQRAALETQAETILKAKGFADVLVMMTGGAAQVMIRGAVLSDQQQMQVVYTVSNVTGVKPAFIAVDAKVH